ncbi:hypothetical protein SteCoe_3492 [Stentor coeruleus]|uniref:Cyclic nucleotide-binding domain-containing protein n=1 Tax=Stentor coeruleus TaxID=5963 RepID=A0A1R2CWZ5_9CILI|nr:hypothetical protein SteCoe_3492 [Stentor coeruleus]
MGSRRYSVIKPESSEDLDKTVIYQREFVSIRSPRATLLKPSSASKTEPCQLKYKAIWRRAFFHIKVQKTLERFKNDLLIYGTSHHVLDMNNQFRDNLDQIFQKKRALELTFTSVSKSKKHMNLLFKSNSMFLSYWNFFLTIFILYIAIFMPIRVAFYENIYWDFWTILDTILDVFFIFDIIVNFFSTYKDKEENEIYNMKKIAIHYLKTWFFMDLIASVPIGLIDFGLGLQDSNTKMTRYSKLVRLSKLPRLYRLLRVFRIMKVLKHYTQASVLNKLVDFFQLNARVLKFAQFLLTMFFFVHFIGCLWYFSALIDEFSPDTWVARNNMTDMNKGSLYLTCIYWAITTITTVGYGDITAKTDLEKVIAITLMICGVGFYSFTIGSLSSFLSTVDTRESVLAQKMAAVNEFIKETNVKGEIKQKIRQAIKFSNRKLGAVWSDKNSLFKELPKNLRYEVALSMYGGIANQLPFFKGKDSAFIVEVIPCLVPMKINEGECVYQIGDYADYAYIIAEGRVSLVTEDEQIAYKSYLKGGFFGEIELLTSSIREETAVTTMDCEFFVLSKKDFITILEEFPVERILFKNIAAKKQKQNASSKKEIKSLILFWIKQGTLTNLKGRDFEFLTQDIMPKKKLTINLPIIENDLPVNSKEVLLEMQSKILKIEKTLEVILEKLSVKQLL